MRTRLQKGFTVIELMAVVAIAMMMAVGGFVTVRGVRRADVSTAAAKLATAVRYTYDTAVLNNGTYRLVLDFESSSWWVERVETSQTCGGVAILPGEDDEKDGDEKDEDSDEDAAGNGVNPWAAGNPFDGGSMAAQLWDGAGSATAAVTGDDEQPSLEDLSEEERMELRRRRARVRDELLKKTDLPTGIKFKMVMTSHQDEPTEEGSAEVYFFPSGYVERAYLYLQRDEDVYTIETVPLKGIGVVHKEELDFETMMAAY